MATETQPSATPDWLLPALFIVGAVVVGLVALLIYNAAGDDGPEQSLVGQLEAYTSCLADHGANVPLVEATSDGGFAVIVPGSLVEGEVDLAQWTEARSACRDVQPNPFGLLFGTDDLGLGELSLMLLPGLLDAGSPFNENPLRGGGVFGEDLLPPDQVHGDRIDPLSLLELCEDLEAGRPRATIDPQSLQEMCELLGA